MTATTTAALLLPATFLACLNVKPTGLSLDGGMNVQTEMVPDLRKVMEEKPGSTNVRTKFGIRAAFPLSDEARAVNHILQGDTHAGLTILLKMEEQQPGDYSTAANLGTAYELLGDNVSALKWIREGIKRNAASHHGTEWLHALILNAKVNSAENPSAPLDRHLLNVPEKLTGSTVVTVEGSPRTAIQLRHALQHQLSERLFFVKPVDPHVADLLYSYALVEANLGTVGSALELLQMAREYGFPDEHLLRKHEKEYRWFLAAWPIKQKITLYLALSALIVVLLYFGRKVIQTCRE